MSRRLRWCRGACRSCCSLVRPLRPRQAAGWLRTNGSATGDSRSLRCAGPIAALGNSPVIPRRATSSSRTCLDARSPADSTDRISDARTSSAPSKASDGAPADHDTGADAAWRVLGGRSSAPRRDEPRGRHRGQGRSRRLMDTFALLRRIAMHEPIEGRRSSGPARPCAGRTRWDNLDGSIERGYAGRRSSSSATRPPT